MSRWVLGALVLTLGLGPAAAVATETELPPAPALTANPTLHAVDLSWPISPDAGVTAYTLYRGTTPDDLPRLSPIGKKLDPIITVPDRTAVPGTTYYYAISATNADGEGPRSTPIAATPTATGIVVATDVFAGPSYNRTDIAVLRPDGSATRLSTDSGYHYSPVVSPDASTMAYSSERGNSNSLDRDLWLHPIGGNTRRLTQDTASSDSGPKFSPDGTTVAFTRSALGSGNGGMQVMTVPVTGGTPTPIGELGDHGPSWSPNGRLLVVSHVNSNSQFTLVLMSPDGKYRHTLAGSGRPSIGGVSWSPDGRSLSYRYRDGNTTWIAVRTLAGGDRNLVGSSQIYGHQWSPLGDKIIYAVAPTPSQQRTLYVVALDGTSHEAVPDKDETLGTDPTIVAPSPTYKQAIVSGATGVSARLSSGEVVLEWEPPAAPQNVCENCPDLGAVVRRSGPDEPAPATPSDGVAVPLIELRAARATGLTDGATYRFSVFMLGEAGDASPPTVISAQPAGEPTPNPTGPVLSALVGAGPNFTASWGPPLPAGANYEVQVGTIAFDKKRKNYPGRPVYKALSSGTARSAQVKAVAGETYWLRARIRDAFGNTTEWGTAIAPVPYDDKSFAAAGTWKFIKAKKAFLGTLRTSARAGDSLVMTTYGSGFALVAQTCKTCGKVKVYLDGKLVRTVDTRSATTRDRQVVWSFAGSFIGKHTIKIVVVGTKGRPTVRVDGLSAER